MRLALPVFLMERLLFAAAPLLFPSKTGLQVMFLTLTKVGIIAFYLHYKPFTISPIVFRLRMTAEAVHYSIYVCLTMFTGFLGDEVVKFNFGFVFLTLFGLLVVVHLSILVQSNIIESVKLRVLIKSKYESIDVMWNHLKVNHYLLAPKLA